MFKGHHLLLASRCRRAQNHTKANILSTLSCQVNTRFTDFLLALLYLITEEVFWAEGAGSVSRNDGLVSVVATLLLTGVDTPCGPLLWREQRISHPSQWGPFPQSEAVAFDFTEVEDGSVDCFEVGESDQDSFTVRWKGPTLPRSHTPCRAGRPDPGL